MELSSNTPLSNLRSSILLTHILNLTYYETLASSTTMATTRSAGAGVGAVISLRQPLDQAHRSLKSSGVGRPGSSESQTLETFNRHFSTVIDPIIIATGIVGNALLALVFLITPLRFRPLSHVLSGLGVIDLIYMTSYTLMYMTKKGVKVYEVPGMCQILNFTLMMSKAIEAWYIFVSHLNRLKAHKPTCVEIQKRRVFNTKFAIFIIAIVVAAPVLHVLWSMETLKVASATYCIVMRETIFVHLTLRKIEVIASVLLPLALIAGVDLILVTRLILHIVFKGGNKENSNNQKYRSDFTSSSCYDKPIVVPLQQEVYRKDSSVCKNEMVDEKINSDGDDLSIALQIAYHLLKETPNSCQYDQEVNTVHNTIAETSLSNISENFKGVSQNISTSTISLDGNSLSYSTPLTEQYHDVIGGYSQCLSISDIEKVDSIEPASSKTSPKIHEQIERQSSVLVLCKDASQLDKIDSVYNSQTLTSSDSNDMSKVKQYKYNVISFVLNSIRKYRLSTGFRFDKHRNISESECVQFSNHTVNCESQIKTFKTTQCQFYECSSGVSILPRKQTMHEDHTFPSDTVACTLTTVLLGVIFAVTFLPSTYTHAVRLFLDSPSSRPTTQAMQQAILFESLVKINAVYKLFLYALVMPSFRSALMWLLTHWIPSKITRFSSICLWGPAADKNELVYV